MMADTRIYDPVTPAIEPDSVCSHIFTRAYAEPVGWKRQPREPHARDLPPLDGTVLVFDTETVEHQLTFGVALFYEKRRCTERVVFHRDDLAVRDPDGYDRLRDICDELDTRPGPRIKLLPLEWLFQNGIWPARKHGWVIAGHNIVYDLSRIADSWERATRTARLGARFCNGFALKHHFTTRAGLQTPIFCRIKRDDRHHIRFDMRNAAVVDTQNADFAYTDRNHSLQKACRTWGIPFDDRPGTHSGEITLDNVAGCLYDVKKTAALLWALDDEHKKYPHRPHLSTLPSGAALAKSDLDALGVRPRFELQPLFDKIVMGQAAESYYGGWVEASIGGVLPIVYLDCLSMFVSAHALLRLWWKHYTAAHLTVEKIPPEEIAALLERIRTDPELLFKSETHDTLDFFAYVRPNGATLPSRVTIPTKETLRRDRLSYSEAQLCEPDAASDSVISIGPVVWGQPLWYAGPDLAHAAMKGGNPEVLDAWRLRPEGGQLDTLQPLPYRIDDCIDPRTDDFFVKLIELRVRKTNDELDDQRRKTGYKVVALSGAYGTAAETNPIDIDPDDEKRKLRPVMVYADKAFKDWVSRPERPGRFNFFPTAALITAEARLLLAMAKHEVERRGGAVAYCDTDSLAVVATEYGDFVPCQGGPYTLKDGRRAIRALSWNDVDEIRQRFAALNCYDPGAIPGSILKCEDENYPLGPDGKPDYTRREQLYCYAVSEKLYALFTIDARGEPHVRKYSSLVLGQLRSPIPVPRDGDPRAWIVEAWTRDIRAALGKPVEPFAWESFPAMEQLTMSTWNVFAPYQTYARPFDFLTVGLISQDRADIAAHPKHCCKTPRPSCLLFDDPAQWRAQKWRCLGCGAEWDFDTFPRLRTYGELVERTLQTLDRKRLNADGSEPTTVMRGVTIPRPVHVKSRTYIGKEVIVDPSDTDEAYTAEMLSATKTLEYYDPAERLNALRAEVEAAGLKTVAREMGEDPRNLRKIVNQKTTPHEATIAKIRAAVEALRCRQAR
jgi:hypothetical protein